MAMNTDPPAARGDFGGGWQPLPGTVSTASTGVNIGTWTIGTGPARPGTPEGMPVGWKCGDCGTVMAPWRAEHRCPPDTGAGAVTAGPTTGPAADTMLYKTGRADARD